MLKIRKIITYSALLFAQLFIFDSCQKTETSTTTNSTTTIVTTVPLPPIDLIANVISPTQVKLSWVDKSTNEKGFKIERKTPSSQFSLVATIGVDSTTLTDNGLTTGATYIYRVYSYNSVGPSPTYSNEVTVALTGFTSPTLLTNNISNITTTGAVVGGDITADGNSNITARGVCWSTTPSPTIALSTRTSDSSGLGKFISTISGLTPKTTYYVRAYATNLTGTGYGQERTFTTIDFATVTTTSISNLKALTASSGGNISSDGGSPVTGRGVCWSTSPNPTVALSTKTVDNNAQQSQTGSFTSNITGLTPFTTYYLRAYALNSAGPSYGPQLTFTTQQVSLPTVNTDNISKVKNSEFTCGGTIIYDGNLPILGKGYCWSTSPNPTVALTTKTTFGAGVEAFSTNIANLTANTLYYVRAYATNSLGTAYGKEVTVTTLSLNIGDVYEGGYIFYLDNSNQHGLVCGLVDIGRAPWGCTGLNITGLSSSIGKGDINTTLILASCKERTAATICDEYRNNPSNFRDDWYLPSLDELKLMYSQLSAKGIGNFVRINSYVNPSYYVSSNQIDKDRTYSIDFSSGAEGNFCLNFSGGCTNEKSFGNFVRPVRKF